MPKILEQPKEQPVVEKYGNNPEDFASRVFEFNTETGDAEVLGRQVEEMIEADPNFSEQRTNESLVDVALQRLDAAMQQFDSFMEGVQETLPDAKDARVESAMQGMRAFLEKSGQMEPEALQRESQALIDSDPLGQDFGTETITTGSTAQAELAAEVSAVRTERRERERKNRRTL
jgi:hypothetical protein